MYEHRLASFVGEGLAVRDELDIADCDGEPERVPVGVPDGVPLSDAVCEIDTDGVADTDAVPEREPVCDDDTVSLTDAVSDFDGVDVWETRLADREAVMAEEGVTLEVQVGVPVFEPVEVGVIVAD
jgi:hypothetical protein